MLTVVVKNTPVYSNWALGINLYYQNCKFHKPEIGLGIGLFRRFFTLGLRLDK